MSKAKVALAGATGVLGTHVLTQLLEAGHEVVVLKRSSSTSKPPSNSLITIAEVDYNSAESITPHLKGCTAVISAVGPAALSGQNPLIDAAVAAGVPRFIPSEFGSDTSNPKAKTLPVFGGKVSTQDYLRKQIASHPSFSYTLINTGPFFDHGMTGFIVNLPAHTARLYDGGNNQFSTTTLPSAGRIVVAVLANLDLTKNRVVYVQDMLISQNEIIELAKKIDGKEWDTQVVNTADVREQSLAEIKKEKPWTGNPMQGFLFSAIHAEGYGGSFEGRLENEALGLKQMNRQEVEEVMRRVLENKK